MPATLQTQQSLLIQTSPARLWDTLTNPEKTKIYMFNCAVASDWKVGSPITWQGNFQGVDAFLKGTVLAIEPERLLKYTLFDPNMGKEDKEENYVHVYYQLNTRGDHTELVVINEIFDGDQERMGHIQKGWDMVFPQIKAISEE